MTTNSKLVKPPSTLLTDAKKSGFKYSLSKEPDINWAEWQTRSHLYVWEAVALSCGIYPTSFNEAYAAFNGSEFENRLPKVTAEVGQRINAIKQNAKGLKHLDSVLLSEVMAFCASCKWSIPSEYNEVKGRPKARKTHKQDILDEIIKLGLTPSSLPPRVNGLPGTKSRIKSSLVDTRPFIMSEKNFNKAWQDLLDEGEIVEPVQRKT